MKYFLLLVTLLVTTGCGSGQFSLAQVSGKVSMDGEPLEGVQVVFAPIESADVIEVGPASVATTDAEGKYTLKTVKGASGVVLATHWVSIGFPELDEAVVAAKVDEAYAKNPGIPERELIAIERKVRKSMSNKKFIPETYNKKTTLQFEVTGKTETADFNLKSDGT